MNFSKLYQLRNILFLLFLGIMLNTSFAQEKSLEESSALDLDALDLDALLNIEVTTASKSAEKVSDAPGIVTVISAHEIKSLGARSLADVLERAPSIQMISSHLFRDNIVSMRGDLLTHNDLHILVLLDGRPMREGVTGGLNSPVYQSFPIELIKHIEIIRGPGSVLYGSNAFAGIINIISKEAVEKTELSIGASAGSFGAVDGDVTFGTNLGDLNIIVSGQITTEEGWDYSAMTRRKPTQTPPDAQVDMKYGGTRYGFSTKMTYKGLKLSGFYSDITEDVLGKFPYKSFAGENFIERAFIDLGYTYDFSENWSANANLTYNLVASTLGKNETVTPSVANSNDYLGEVSVNGSILENLNTVIGVILDTRNKNSVPFQSTIPATYNQSHFTTYLQFDYRPIKELKLIAGAQINKPNEGDVDVVPRLGAIYNFANGLGIKALYGSAFRSPWPLEQMVDISILQGNADLTPEKIQTLDFQVFYATQSSEYSLTFFNSNYSDLINRVNLTPGVQTFVNSGEMTVTGVEGEVKVNLTKRLYLLGSFMYQDNKDDVTVLATTMVKAGAFYNTKFGLNIGLFNTFFGEPKENGGAELNQKAEAVSLLSLNLNYKIPTLPVELNVYAKNLLDQDYYFTEFSKNMINSLPMGSGRSIYGTLRLRI